MLDQYKKAQMEEISLISDSINESMSVVERVSEHVCNNEELKLILSQIQHRGYRNQEEFQEECRKLHFIDEYVEYYQEEIASVNIYVENENFTTNRYITFVDAKGFKNTEWYEITYYYKGKNYWSYAMDDEKKQKRLQLTRTIENEKGETLGLLRIQLQMKQLKERLEKRSANTLLLFGNNQVIATNVDVGSAHRAMFRELKKAKEESAAIIVEYQVRDYLLTYERIYRNEIMDYYTVVSVQDYQSLMSNMTRSNFVSVSTVVAGLIFSFVLILMFSMLFENRTKKLFQQMHLVATGDYEHVEPIEGTDEIALIYRQVEHMMEDIQELTDRLVQERVHKERLHTKQKEVEFKMLADQINPHFIYNTLETIRMKAKMNHEPEIEELVKMLAKIMRRNLQTGTSMVSLASEIELMEYYLVIQGYRFGDRIHSDVVVDENVDTSCEVMPLIMQPFVENAYVHGLESVNEDGYLKIHVMEQGEEIHITIEDNGAGMGLYQLGQIRQALREGVSSDTEHIGINNVNQRIRILYGEDYGVRVESALGRGTRISICIPKRRDEN